ncbi:MAG: oxidoreductase, partial [Pseudobdellovibrio sp.]
GSTIKKAGSQEAFKVVDHDYVVEFAKLAQACKAEQLLVVSSLGADKNSSVFFNRIKGETEFDVQSVFKSKLHFMRPSLLLGDRNEFRFGERMAILLAPVYSPLLLGPLETYKPVQASDVAQAMLNIATKKISASMLVNNLEIINIAKS